MRYGKLALVAAIIAVMAQKTIAQEPVAHTAEKLPANVLSTGSFSLAFPENWQTKKITKGMVSAATHADASPQASADVYYYVLPPNASDRSVKRFHARQKKHSVNSYVDKKEVRKAKWKSKPAKTALNDGITVEQFDMEILQRSPAYKKRKTPVCRFFRLYHAARAEVHVTYSQRGTCEASRDGFNRFISLLRWS